MVRLPAQTQLHHRHGGGKNCGLYLAFNWVYDLFELSFKVLKVNTTLLFILFYRPLSCSQWREHGKH